MKSGDYMNYYYFKLNLSWQTLYDYDQKKDYLVSEVIPSKLELVYDLEKSENYEKYRIFLGDVADKRFYEDFNLLEENTIKLITMYDEIVSNYMSSGSISYSKEFLELNEICKRARGAFQSKYPIVKEGLQEISDQTVLDKFSLNLPNQVGTGITHIKNFYKLKIYIEELKKKNMLNQSRFEAYYDCQTEQLVIGSDKEEEALACIYTIEKELNSSQEFVNALGKININPIYTKLEFTRKFSSIEFTLVYPNGVASGERYEAIMEGSKAKKQKVKLVGEDEDSLDINYILETLNDQAVKGYLEDVTRSLVKKVIRKSTNYLF